MQNEPGGFLEAWRPFGTGNLVLSEEEPCGVTGDMRQALGVAGAEETSNWTYGA
jgi:hypothetical protein